VQAVSSKQARPLVLCYHAVSSTWRSQLAISERLLERQLRLIAARGYVGLTLSEAERRRADGSLPDRSVVVTFDDGFASTLRALPILAEVGFPGTVFPVTGFVGSGATLSWPGIEHEFTRETEAELRPLRWPELETLQEVGWEVGSHTVGHPLLTAVDDARLETELQVSRVEIVERLGCCDSVSYPYGRADERVAAAAARAGYTVACTLAMVHLEDEPLRRPRVNLATVDTGLRLRLQVAPRIQSLRRSRAARLARTLHRNRSWLPEAD
jgi:peptidoglycan/xylan/chitin deacetylase (PgdA/CDA1 family)